MKQISDEIDLKYLEYEAEPSVWEPVLLVYVEPAETQDVNRVALTWTVVEYGPSYIHLQLVFEQPLYISFELEADVLVVNFQDQDLFITENGIQILPENRILRRNLRR